MKEEWKDIKEYEGVYQISNLGNVKNIKTNKLLKTFKNNKGYYRVGLCLKGIEKKYLLHRLIAESFIPNPNNLPEINHIDENPQNISIENLEWCTQKYNVNYGTMQKRSAKKRSKPVYQYDVDGKLIKIWGSVKECRRNDFTNVWSICNNKSKLNRPYKNHLWSYFEL